MKQIRPQNCGTNYCSCIECVMEDKNQISDIDLMLCEMEHENRMIRARNERLERELKETHKLFVQFLMDMHEKSKHQHNHFHWAANIYKTRLKEK